MSLETAGAIIRIVYYILLLDNRTKRSFSADYLSAKYNELLRQSPHKERIEDILIRSKKHGNKNRMKTLEDRNRLLGWLNKHTYRKPILWFNKTNGSFALKSQYIEPLERLMREEERL